MQLHRLAKPVSTVSQLLFAAVSYQELVASALQACSLVRETV